MSKKYLLKNEIRVDLNPEHLNRFGYPHDVIITARKGHKFKANIKTHPEYVNGVKCLDLELFLSDNVKHKRISQSFWQNENQFGDKKGKDPKKLRAKIKKYNKKFYK